MKKVINFLFGKSHEERGSSEFSRFFHEASSREKKQVYMDVARKASADQRKLMESTHATPQPIN